MKRRSIILTLTACAAALLASQPAFAQIGPELIPPGLDSDHPIDSYTKEGSKKLVEDWRHEASWELNTNDVVFSAAKKRQLISEAPSTIHVITDREISAHGWRSLPEILRHIPGVQTLMTKSQFQSVMIRGLVGTEDNNSRILWLQNGVPMNDVRDSGIWLDETYPIELIKRIEVVLGPGSALYGSGAFQGVVNIFTKDPGDIDPHGEYRLAVQNNLTFKASAIAGYTSENGNFGILGHVAGNTTQGPGLIGDYAYGNYIHDQTVENTTNDRPADVLRAENVNSNSDKHWYNINFKLNYKALKWNIGFTDIYAGADGSETITNVDTHKLNANNKDLEGLVGKDDLGPNEPYTDHDRFNYRFNRREAFTDIIYEDNFGDSVSFLALISYRFTHYDTKHYRNYDNHTELADYCDPETSKNCDIFSYKNKINFDSYQHKLYGLAQLQWRIYEANELIAGLVLEYQHITSPDFSNGEEYFIVNENEPNYNTPVESLDATKLGQLTPSVFLQDEQRFWDDRIILTAGARFDAYRIYKSSDMTPDYAPSWRFAFLGKWTDWMTMRISYGHSFKEPSLYQLYANTFDYVGNTALKPETLENIELSFLFTPTYFMKIRLDGFVTLMDNLIISQLNPNISINALGENRYQPTQNGGANIYGFEFSLNTAIGRHWNLYTHYNFLYSKKDYFENEKISTNDDNKEEENTESNIVGNDRVPDDAMHRFTLGATFMNDYLTADMAFFLVGGTPKTRSNSGWKSRPNYETPLYAIFQPHISVNVGANIGLMLQGSYAFSEGMTKSPTYRFYYEKENIPVARYSVLFSLLYPFRK